MMYELYGTGTGFGITWVFLNIVIILIVVVAVVTLLNRSNYVAVGSEQLARMEKDLEDVKRTAEEIKNKPDEI